MRKKRERQAKGLARTRFEATVAPDHVIGNRGTKKSHQSTAKSAKVLGKLPSELVTDNREDRSDETFDLLGPFPLTKWQENLRDEGEVSCIYVLYDVAKRPVRIGQTKDLRRRIKEYEDNYWWFRSPTVESFAYVKVNDQQFRRKAEKVMIKLVGEYAIFNVQERI
jgi:hypothetical protein